MRTIMTLLILMLNVNLASADPIQDQYFLNKEVGCFQSNGQSCKRVCNDMKRSQPEAELYYSSRPANKVTYTCKTNLRTRTSRGEVYGNNYQATPNACIVALPNGKAVRKSQFQCLCVI